MILYGKEYTVDNLLGSHPPHRFLSVAFFAWFQARRGTGTKTAVQQSQGNERAQLCFERVSKDMEHGSRIGSDGNYAM